MLSQLILGLVLTAAPAKAGGVPPAVAELAQKIGESLAAKDASVLDQAIDVDAIVARSMNGLDVKQDFATGFKSGVVKSKGLMLGTQFLKSGLGENETQLLRTYVEKGASHALYRLTPGGGINYLDLEFGIDAKGRAVVRDAYPHIQGENISTTLRSSILKAVAEMDQGLLARLKGADRDYLDNAKKISEFAGLVQTKKVKEAVALYQTLPASVRTMKPMMVMYVQAVQGLGDDQRYLAALTEYEKAFPDDPSRDLHSIDAHLLRKDYAATVKAVERIDARVDDPYLETLKGNVWTMAGDLAAAKKAFRRGIERDRTLTAAYDGLLSLSLTEKNHAETTRLINEIEKNTGLVFGDLKDAEGYEAYVKSAEYKKWMKSRAN